MNNGQMDRGNENPTQHLPWWLRKTTKKPQSGWSAPGFEPRTSRMWVLCVTTEPPRSVSSFLFHIFYDLIPILFEKRNQTSQIICIQYIKLQFHYKVCYIELTSSENKRGLRDPSVQFVWLNQRCTVLGLISYRPPLRSRDNVVAFSRSGHGFDPRSGQFPGCGFSGVFLNYNSNVRKLRPHLFSDIIWPS